MREGREGYRGKGRKGGLGVIGVFEGRSLGGLGQVTGSNMFLGKPALAFNHPEILTPRKNSG